MTRPYSVHGSRTSCSQKKDSFLPAPSLLAFVDAEPSSFAAFQSTRISGDISSFAFTPVYWILTSFWDQLGFRNNTEAKCLKRAVLYRRVFYSLLEYRRGQAPALLVLITPLWSSASQQCRSQHCLSLAPIPAGSRDPVLLPAAELPQEKRLKATFNCLQASFCFPPRWQSLYPSRHTAHLAKTLLNTSFSMCRNSLVRKDLMCFFQLPLNQQEQAHVISLGLKGCRCKSLLFYKLPLYFSSQAIVGLNSLTLSHRGPVRVNALNDKALTTERRKQFRQSSSCYVISLSSVAWHRFCLLWCNPVQLKLLCSHAIISSPFRSSSPNSQTWPGASPTC